MFTHRLENRFRSIVIVSKSGTFRVIVNQRRGRRRILFLLFVLWSSISCQSESNSSKTYSLEIRPSTKLASRALYRKKEKESESRMMFRIYINENIYYERNWRTAERAIQIYSSIHWNRYVGIYKIRYGIEIPVLHIRENIHMCESFIHLSWVFKFQSSRSIPVSPLYFREVCWMT